MDDVTWFVEGASVEEVASGLERCAEESLVWARGNAVRFETVKTEAILLSRRRSHGRAKRKSGVVVDGTRVPFASGAARWLGVKGGGTYLGRNKEVFDAEVFAILQAIRLLNGREERIRVTRSFQTPRQPSHEFDTTTVAQHRLWQGPWSTSPMSSGSAETAPRSGGPPPTSPRGSRATSEQTLGQEGDGG